MSKDKGKVESDSLDRINKSAKRGKKRIDMIHSADKGKRKTGKDQYIPDYKLHEY